MNKVGRPLTVFGLTTKGTNATVLLRAQPMNRVVRGFAALLEEKPLALR